MHQNANLLTHETHALQKTVTLPQEETPQQKMVRGVGKQLLSQASINELDAVLVLVLCNEGDNTPHGIHLAQLVALDVLFDGNVGTYGEKQIQWKIPSSWVYMFGPPPNSSLY